MARAGRKVEIVASILDRLIDDNPGTQQEALGSNLQDVRALERSVVRDLENLLNTRREALWDLPPEFVEVSKSVLMYGMPDLTSFNLLSPNDRNRLRRTIEMAIAAFEPRLQRVRVTTSTPGQNDQALHFRIEALLHVEPAPEPIAFDTILQVDTQKYSVRS